jgi:catechol 2,3-dioxygenase-like lactoylglutathione lyase family enzyme
MEIVRGAIDVGIVVRDGAEALRFYQDTLGLEHLREIPTPARVGPGTIHFLGCGASQVKILALETPPAESNPPGGTAGGTGFRYLTIQIDDLGRAIDEVERAGFAVSVPINNPTPGLRMAMVEDPDGNWVELLEIDEELLHARPTNDTPDSPP